MIALALLTGIVVLPVCGVLGLTPDSRDATYAMGSVIAAPLRGTNTVVSVWDGASSFADHRAVPPAPSCSDGRTRTCRRTAITGPSSEPYFWDVS